MSNIIVKHSSTKQWEKKKGENAKEKDNMSLFLLWFEHIFKIDKTEMKTKTAKNKEIKKTGKKI